MALRMDSPSLEDLLEGLKRFADANEQEKAELRRELYDLTAGKCAEKAGHQSKTRPASEDEPMLEETNSLPALAEKDLTKDASLRPEPNEKVPAEKTESSLLTSAPISEASAETLPKDVWCRSLPTLLRTLGGYNHRSMSKYITTRREQLLRQEELKAGLDGHSLSWLMASPASAIRRGWDMLSFVLIFSDLVVVPIHLFDPPDSVFFTLEHWLGLAFWTANIGAELTVGYFHKGTLVMSPRKIIMNYLKTWFVVDMICLVPDWIVTVLTLAMEEGPNSESNKLYPQMARAVKISRWLRMGRLLRLKKSWSKVDDLLASEWGSVVADICKMLLLLLINTHFVACLWYYVGTESQQRNEPSWIDTAYYTNASWGDQYAVAFHWAITQFTPSAKPFGVHPENTSERVFAIVVVVFALVGFSYIVGSITGSLTHLRNKSQQATKDLWRLRRFFSVNKINSQLALRIEEFTWHVLERQRSIIQSDSVTLLTLLPEQMTLELHYELSIPTIAIHPFFVYMQTEAILVLQQLCFKALVRKQFATNELVFLGGMQASHMYFVSRGTLAYWMLDEGHKPTKEEAVTAGVAWVAEPALWAHKWRYLGFLAALEECELLCLCAAAFSEVVTRDDHMRELAMSYATGFVGDLSQSKLRHQSDVAQAAEHSQKVIEHLPYDPVDRVGTTSSLSHMRRNTMWVNLTRRIRMSRRRRHSVQ
eukprot:TRINITY_DN1486_c0_g1_i1.p1 TRINITY_DN1486_c0_g1~~TRINITY_DN1486_c0_g1_i1.p1  ORF type:complete len:707 (+),score=111.12 TRINITY_DN1486_c0_g1_i1:53-2173(+)